ncbi:hypothetical protein [Hafnia paralvei]|uniref:hypothetical protein n=1 Tax=Hafnia paralvei TaxID=546367 RepID=UPI0020330CAB|nr:hypothetical protein [Hafnia paralvei]
MMKNKFMDLINHNFCALERLNQEDMTSDDIKVEIARAKAIADVSSVVINGYNTVLEANRQVYEGYTSNIPAAFGLEDKSNGKA